MPTLKSRMLCIALVMTLTGCTAGSDESADAALDETSTDAEAGSPPAVEEPERVQIPSGTALTFEISERLSTADNATGQTFTASIAEDVVVDGNTVIPAGAAATSRILEATQSGRIQGVAEIALQITAVSVGGKMIPVSTRTFEARAETTRTEDTTRINAGAGIGAVVGGIREGETERPWALQSAAAAEPRLCCPLEVTTSSFPPELASTLSWVSR